jgi:hypothetical protein
MTFFALNLFTKSTIIIIVFVHRQQALCLMSGTFFLHIFLASENQIFTIVENKSVVISISIFAKFQQKPENKKIKLKFKKTINTSIIIISRGVFSIFFVWLI